MSTSSTPIKSSGTPYIKFDQFNPACLIKTSPDAKKKTVLDEKTGKEQEITYFDIPCLYQYDTEDDKGNKTVTVSAFRVEGSELSSSGGILYNTKGDRETASIFTSFDLNNTETRRMVECRDSCNPPYDFKNPEEFKRLGFFEQLYLAALTRIFEERGQFGGNMATLRSLESMEGAVKSPIYWPRDKKTSALVNGKNPTKYFPLTCYGKKNTPFRKETVFTIPFIDPITNKPQIVPWETLVNVNMRFIPMWLIKKYFVAGGAASIQMEIESAIITFVERATTGSAQTDHAATMAQDKVLSASLADQIALLTKQVGSYSLEPSIPKSLPLLTDGKEQTTSPTNTLPQIGYTPTVPQLPQATYAPQTPASVPIPTPVYANMTTETAYPAATQATDLMNVLSRGPVISTVPAPIQYAPTPIPAPIQYAPVPVQQPAATPVPMPAIVQQPSTMVIS
jgi:hypothetical protein